jgi:antitoxin (DNA-binding transcriptional repressor) of toxin-antitoxin stability system
MRTTDVREVPRLRPRILEWIGGGEEVQLTKKDKVVARLVPAAPAPAKQPDFLARAKAVWGSRPQGKPLSALVAEARVQGQPIVVRSENR